MTSGSKKIGIKPSNKIRKGTPATVSILSKSPTIVALVAPTVAPAVDDINIEAGGIAQGSSLWE